MNADLVFTGIEQFDGMPVTADGMFEYGFPIFDQQQYGMCGGIDVVKSYIHAAVITFFFAGEGDGIRFDEFVAHGIGCKFFFKHKIVRSIFSPLVYESELFVCGILFDLISQSVKGFISKPDLGCIQCFEGMFGC